MRPSKRTDVVLEIEVGRKAERQMWDENHHPTLVPLEDIFASRAIRGRREAKKYAAQQGRQPRRSFGPRIQHGIYCPCDGCEAAVKRLLRDCGVLP